MKKLFYVIIMVVITSCNVKPEYPKYNIDKIVYIPDSLKVEHREWIKETVRAASQHMTGGRYEDVSSTIVQAERTANRLFGVEVYGLRKEISDNYFEDIWIIPDNFNEYEKEVFDSLFKSR